MAIYLPSGYLDIAALDAANCTWNVIVGGRGTGKTVGLLMDYLRRREPVVYMRRTDTQAKIAGNPNFTPYKTPCSLLGLEYYVVKGTPKILMIKEDSPDSAAKSGKTHGVAGKSYAAAYIIALSNFDNVRGFDASDCAALIYDEFIPQRNERPIEDEGHALLNAYETINRNRELEGRPPLKMWMLANSNRIDSPILQQFGLMHKMLKMSKNGTEREIIRERDMQVCQLNSSPISERKRNTAMYQIADQRYTHMSLDNQYVFDDSYVKSRSLAGYKPVVCLAEICIYASKQDGRYYLSPHKRGSPKTYGLSTGEIEQFRRYYYSIIDQYMLGKVTVEDVETDYMFRNILKL